MARNTVIVSVLADTKNLTKGVKGVGGMFGGLVKTAAKTVAGIGAAVGGLALAGGFKRALNIDEARTQLGALGYDSKQVTGIMDSALKSVQGTAFGLDSAATIAAQALAAGVPEGKRLTGALTTVANTAALAKVDMGEMGSIFSKVWANGKVTTQEMNQLADRGVPIWQYLSEAFGVGTDELRKMITAGDVTADMFENALGPAVEGMATKMGGSARGMARNLLAALSRVGAMFAGPMIEAAKPWMQVLTDGLDRVGELIGPVAEKFADWLGGLDPGTVLAVFKPFFTALPGVLDVVSQLSPVAALFKALAPLGGQLAAALSAIMGAVSALWPQVQNLAGLLGTGLLTAATVLANLLVGVLVPAITGLANFIAQNADVIGALAVAIGVGVLAYKAWGAAIVIWQGITKAAAAVQKAFNLVMKANPIMLVVTAVAALVAGLVYFFTQTETGQKIWAKFVKFLSAAWQVLVAAGKKAIDAIVSGWTNLMNWFGQLPGKIKGYFSTAGRWLLQQGKQILVGLATGIIDRYRGISQWFRDLPGKIKGFFSSVGSWLLGVGKDLIRGLGNGILAMGQWVLDKIGGVINGAVDWAKGLLGIRSPSRVFRDIGGNVGRGLADGIARSTSAVKRAAGGLATATIGGFGTPTLSVAGGGWSSSAAQAGRPVEINVTAGVGDPVEIGREVASVLRSYTKSGGTISW